MDMSFQSVELRQMVDYLHSKVGQEIMVTYGGKPLEGVVGDVRVAVRGILTVDPDSNSFKVESGMNHAYFKVGRIIMLAHKSEMVDVPVVIVA